MMSNSTKVHVDNNYYMEIKPYPKLDGLMIKIPKNIFLELDSETRFYEFDNCQMSVYKNGKKVETYTCPRYAKRCALSSEIQNIVSNRLISDSCVLWYDKDGKLINDENKQFVMHIIESDLSEHESKLEMLLLSECRKYAENNNLDIDENVVDGWNIIVERCTKI